MAIIFQPPRGRGVRSGDRCPAHDVDALFRKFRERGLATPGNPDAPQMVHEGPIDQTWGTREFYVDDPDGNTLRFTQGFLLPPISEREP